MTFSIAFAILALIFVLIGISYRIKEINQTLKQLLEIKREEK